MTGKWHGGKGSNPRPLDTSKWDEQFTRIFGDKNKEKSDDGQRKKS